MVKKIFSKKKWGKYLFTIFAACIAISFIGLHFFTNNSPSVPKENETKITWQWEKATNFKFEYPSSWGMPKGTRVPGYQEEGVQYYFIFSQIQPGFSLSKGTSIILHAYSDNIRVLAQDGRIMGRPSIREVINSGGSTLSKEAIKTLVYSDESLYVYLITDTSDNERQDLLALRLVSIPKDIISGVTLHYIMLQTSKECPKYTVVDDIAKNCITTKILEEVKRTISSLQIRAPIDQDL